MAGIKDRSFTYRGQIKVSKGDLRLARSGQKTCTIRLGTAIVQEDEIDLTDGRDRVRVRIVGVDTHRPYAEISEAEARADGVGSLEELDADLRRFYGSLDPQQPMTLIHFAVQQAEPVYGEQSQLFS